MRILDISAVTDTSEIPIKQGTLQFLQDAYKEIVTAALCATRASDYDPSIVYILYGIINTATAPFYSITAGAVFYQGEIFLVDAANFTATGSNVAVFNIVISQYTVYADPTTFTDGVDRNVHDIRKMQITQGLSGSALADYSQLKRYFVRLPAIKNPEMYIGDPADFDTNGIGITAETIGYALCDGQVGRPDLRGLFAVGYKPGDADFGMVTNSGGAKTHILTIPEMPAHTHNIESTTGGGGSNAVNYNGTFNASTPTLPTGGGLPHSILNPFFVVMYVIRLY